MRKYGFFALLVCIVTLSACSVSTDSEDQGDYFTESIQTTDAVFNCLVNKDAEGIKALLCEQLNNSPDVDAQLQGLFNSIDGNILDMELNNSRSVTTAGASIQDGEYTSLSTIGTIKDLKTDANKTYKELLIFYCFVDKRNSDLEGVYGIILAESDTANYKVLLPENSAEPEEDYGTVYTPDGPRPATKEEQEAMLGEGATE